MAVHTTKARGVVTSLDDVLPSIVEGDSGYFMEAIISAWNTMARGMHVNSVDKGFWDVELQALSLADRVTREISTSEDERELLYSMCRRNTGELIALMHSELSEGLEGDRKPHPDKHCPEFDNLAVELADTVIRIMEFGYARDIPIAEALIAKADANARRPFMHGGKKY